MLPATPRGILLSHSGSTFTTVAAWHSDSEQLELEGKPLRGTIEANGSLRLESVEVADDLNLRAADARAQQAHVLQKRREDMQLVQRELLALEQSLRQPPSDDEDEEEARRCGVEIVRLNQVLGQHEREVKQLEEQRELKVTYTETIETTALTLPPGVLRLVPALAATPLLWCPSSEPTVVRNSELRNASVEAAPCATSRSGPYVLPQPGPGGTLRRAAALCASSSGKLYAIDEEGGHVWDFDLNVAGNRTCNVSRTLGKKRRLRPIALAYCHGRFYMTDSEAHGLVVISGGPRPEAAHVATVREGGHWTLHGVAALDSTLFVTDRAKHVVRALSVSAEPGSERLLFQWGSRGAAPGQFDSPAGLACADGRVWVADSLNHRIQAFEANDGRLVAHWGQPGTQAGALCRPQALALCQGLVLVADCPGAWRVQAFTPAGQWVSLCSTMSGLARVPALAAFAGDVLVSGYEHGNIIAFQVNGSSAARALPTSQCEACLSKPVLCEACLEACHQE